MLNKNELISDIKDKRKTCNYVWLIIIAALASADIIAWIYISINTKLSLPAFILFHIFSFAYIFFDLKLREKYYVNDIVSTIRFDLITSITLIIALILKYTLRSYYVFIGWAVSCVIFISSYFIQKKLFLDNPLLTNYIYFNNGQLTEKIYFDFNSFKFSSNPIEKEDENKIASLDVIDKTYTFCVNMADSCNLNCTYCYQKVFCPTKEFEKYKVKSIDNQIRELTNVRDHLTHGERLLEVVETKSLDPKTVSSLRSFKSEKRVVKKHLDDFF